MNTVNFATEIKKPFQKMIWISFVSLLSFTTQGEVYFPNLISKKQRASFKFHSEYYNSLSNYTVLGEYVNLPDSNYFKYASSHLSANFSPAQWVNFELFATSLWGESLTKNIKRQRWIPTFFGGGITLFKHFDQMIFGLEVKGGMPFSYNKVIDDELILSDGVYFVNPHLWVFYQHSSKIFYLFYNMNVLYRAHQLSSLMFNKMGGVFQTHIADFGVSTELFIPLTADRDSNYPQERWDLMNKNNGGSYKIYSVNPAALSFTAWAEWKLDPLFLNIYGNIDTYGKNYGRGFTVGTQLTFKFKTKKQKKKLSFKSYKKRKSSKKSKSSNQYFQETEDPYSKELKKELKQLR